MSEKGVVRQFAGRAAARYRLAGFRFGIGIVAFLVASAAPAFELFDDRIQVHGFYESQLRVISADFAQEWDLSQWYQVLNLELELELLRNPVGPIDMVSGFVRFEGRFDCVYLDGCGVFRSSAVYGNSARKLPRRLNNARGNRFAGAIEIEADTGRLSGPTSRTVTLDETDGFAVLAGQGSADGFDGNPSLSADCLAQFGAQTCGMLAGGDGDSRVATLDDGFPFIFASLLDLRFTQIQGRGGANSGNPIRVLGPWRPKDRITANATLADRVNPFDASRQSPVLLAATYNTFLLDDSTNSTTFLAPDAAFAAARTVTGSGARPFRPIPVSAEGRAGEADGLARGVYIPSRGLRRALEAGRVGEVPLNFGQTQRAFNRGASQQDEGELKEAYLDIELFDSRLWLRVGKQSIVWGKTELFRTTDQFNPQDLALSSLPSLEESRIPLWALRGIWSLYNVGPFQDLRVELAANLDDFEPADFGACGEPYTVLLVCQAAFGLVAHGATGIGLVGVDKPPSPWQSLEGWEVGGRVEFRYDRFSFAISDFWGYSDIPYPERITTFERNVDPLTGWPRIMAARGPCTDGTQLACLHPGPTASRTLSSDPTRPNDPLLQVPNPAFDTTQQQIVDDPNNALLSHHANQQLFAMICSTTIGIVDLDRSACAQNAFGSQVAPQIGIFTISQIVSAVLGGSSFANQALGSEFGLELPVASLSIDPGDLSNAGTDCTDDRYELNTGPSPECGSGGGGAFAIIGHALGQRLTPEQEALVGCGPLWGTNCDDSGLDLLNADATALLQSFAGFDGTVAGWRTDDASRAQPGTVGFSGGPVCPTFHLGSGRADLKLPGCRGPGDPLYEIAVDGDPSQVTSILPALACPVCIAPGASGHPFTGQPWQNELAALSWNFQLVSVFQDDAFDPDDPYNADGEHCSFITPQNCPNIQGLLRLSAMQRNVARAGGNSRFGRRDFQWHSGGELLLRFDKRNVLGFAFDFAEDRSKANFSLEFTWIGDVPQIDNDAFDGITRVDEFNLTLSLDRPTFVNFLNANRTFFLNTQWFIQYRSGRTDGFATPAWNALGTLAISTGYYQDRLLPSLVFVYDVYSRSGAALPAVSYRYSESFSVTLGAAIFSGRSQLVNMPVNEVGPGNRAGPNAFKDQTENGLAVLRDNDELFLRVRYTF